MKRKAHIRQIQHIYTIKITSSDTQKESKKKSQKRYAKHPDGLCATLNEMLHVMLQYPELYTDFIFFQYSQFH